MRFHEDQPAQEVRWFFCGPQAEVFDAPTPFRSRNYESTPDSNTGLGEQRPGNRPWVNGIRPTGLDGRGRGCGFPLAWWDDGIPSDGSFTISKNANGVPTCCLDSSGSVLVSGDSLATRFGPGSRLGGVLVGGGESVELRFNPGAVLVSGDAEVHFHPPAPIMTTCCGLVPAELIASFDDGGLCPCLAGVTCPITWDGAQWTGTTLPFCAGHTFTVRFYCTGVGALAWKFDLDIDGVNEITGGITFVGSCGPLHFEGSPAWSLTAVGCPGTFAQLIVDEP